MYVDFLLKGFETRRLNEVLIHSFLDSWEPDFVDELSPDLCNACQNIFKSRKWQEIYNPYDATRYHLFDECGTHHLSYESFQSAVEQGCYVCVALYNTIPVNFSVMTENMASDNSTFMMGRIYDTRGCARDSPYCGSFRVSLRSLRLTSFYSVVFKLLRMNGESLASLPPLQVLYLVTPYAEKSVPSNNNLPCRDNYKYLVQSITPQLDKLNGSLEHGKSMDQKMHNGV